MRIRTDVPGPSETLLLMFVSGVRPVLLRRRRTHFETPLARAAANIQNALGAPERGKPVVLFEEGADDQVLHVQTVLLGLYSASAADEARRRDRGRTGSLGNRYAVLSKRVAGRRAGEAMRTSSHIPVIGAPVLVHIVPDARGQRLCLALKIDVRLGVRLQQRSATRARARGGTYISLDGRVALRRVGQVCRRRERPQRATADGSHHGGGGGRQAAPLADEYRRGEGEIQLDGHVVPRTQRQGSHRPSDGSGEAASLSPLATTPLHCAPIQSLLRPCASSSRGSRGCACVTNALVTVLARPPGRHVKC
jgi:hypothetical protein